MRSIVYGYRFPARPEALKIGYSGRGIQRIYEQTTGFPEMPEVVFVLHHPDAAAIEHRIHQDLAHRQLHDMVGVEWFRADLDDVAAVSPELRRAMGIQRWKSPWRWLFFLVSLLMGGIIGPILARELGITNGLDVTAYRAALWEGHPVAWRFALREAWGIVVGPAEFEARLVSSLLPLLGAWLAFGRR